jgi:rSAM/selenodomain-associated transferase 1
VRAELLIIFVKAPRPGTVKTRLAREIGEAAACAAYCRMVNDLRSNLARLEPVEIRFTPDDARKEVVQWLRPGWRLAPQGVGELGTRLQAAFAQAFASGSKRVVVIGSDCPTVTASDIELGWNELQAHDMVIGPAQDGGYWLIGLRSARPRLFQEINWSTSTVLVETLKRAEAAGLKVKLMRQRSDIDSPADWKEFLREAGG